MGPETPQPPGARDAILHLDARFDDAETQLPPLCHLFDCTKSENTVGLVWNNKCLIHKGIIHVHRRKEEEWRVLRG